MKSGDFVLPGYELGFAEEFIPGNGTYEKDGRIFSSATGTLKIETEHRRIEVEPMTNAIPEPQLEDVVIGKVLDVKPQFAPVKLLRLMGISRKLPGSVYGTIHISKTKPTYVQDLSRELCPGDVVRAEVVNTNRQPLALSTEKKELGVIKAYCSRCNIPLRLEKNKLKCPRCSRIESRKFATDYGKGNV